MQKGKKPRITRANGEAASIRVNAEGELLIAWPNVTVLLIEGRNRTKGAPVKLDSRERLDDTVSRIASQFKERPVVSIEAEWDRKHPAPPQQPPPPPALPKRTNWT